MNWQIARLAEKKNQVLQASQAVLDKAEAEGRELTAAESQTLADNRAKTDELQADISKKTAYEKWAATVPAIPNEGLRLDGRVDVDHGPAGGMAFVSPSSGNVLRALLPNQSFCPRVAEVGDGEPNFCGRVLHSWLVGRTDSPSFQASSMQGNVDTGGGYLLEPSLSQIFVDFARAQSVCVRAGAQTIPMETGELHLTRASSDPTSYWRAEGVGVTASTRNLERVKLIARTLACVIPISLELLQDASNAPKMLEDAMAAAMGLKLDQAALAGAGAAAEPLGIRNISGTNSVASVGTPTDYSKASSAVKKILQANYNGDIGKLAWIQNPRDAATYDGLQDTLHQPLRPTPWVAQLQQLYTSSVSVTEGAGAESYGVIGDFSQMLFGMRTSGIILRRLPAGQVTDLSGITHNAAAELKEFLVAYLRADVALLRPSWFTLLTGITA